MYRMLNNSSKQERTTCLKSGLKSAKNMQKLKIRATLKNFNMKTLFIYLFLNNYF
jgi:hypothetical protein